jgi:hypothetical protein
MARSTSAPLLASTLAACTTSAVADQPNGNHSTVQLVSVNRSGKSDVSFSVRTAISGNGRVVAFDSFAFDLVKAADDNGRADVYARNLQTGATMLVIIDAAGTGASGFSSLFRLGPSISTDGDAIAFGSAATDLVHNGGGHGLGVFVDTIANP